MSTELEKDAANLLFALHDAWPYVHQHCTINSVRDRITALIRKHGDFAPSVDVREHARRGCGNCSGGQLCDYPDCCKRKLPLLPDSRPGVPGEYLTACAKPQCGARYYVWRHACPNCQTSNPAAPRPPGAL